VGPGRLAVVRSQQRNLLVRWCASTTDVHAELMRRPDVPALIDVPDVHGKRRRYPYESVRWLLEDRRYPGVVVATSRALAVLDEPLRDRMRPLRSDHVLRGRPHGSTLHACGLPEGSAEDYDRARRVADRIRELGACKETLPVRIAHRLGSPSLPGLLALIMLGPQGLRDLPDVGRATVDGVETWLSRSGLLDWFHSWQELRDTLMRTLYEEPERTTDGSPAAAASARAPDPTESEAHRPASLAVLVARLPPRLRRLPLVDLPVTTARARKALAALGARPIEELATLGEAELVARPNFGRRSLHDVRDALQRLASRVPGTLVLALATGEGRLFDVLRARVAALPERQRAIAEDRIFAPPGRRRTLDVLARRLGVSRERIRQMEGALLERIGAGEGVADLLDARLSAAASVRAMPLTPENLQARDPFFDGVAESPEILAALLVAMGCRHRLVPPANGVPAFFSSAGDRLDAWTADLRTELAGAPAQSLEPRVREFATTRGCPELTPALLGRLEPALDGPEGLLFAPRRGDTVEAVLLHADGPLHVDEVHRRLAQVGHVLSAQAVRGALVRRSLVNVGRSTYVHASKLEAWKRYEKEVVRLVEGIMLRDKSRLWKSRELLGRLSDAGATFAATLPWFALDYLLSQRNDKFQRTGRGLWCLAGQSPSGLTVRKLAAAMVRENGPMSPRELEGRVGRLRGLSGHFLPRPPLFRLPDGRIGHLDRDLPIDPQHIDRFAAAVEAELREKQGILARQRVVRIFRKTVPDGSTVAPKTIMFLAAHRGGYRMSRSLRFLGSSDVRHAVLDAQREPQVTGS